MAVYFVKQIQQFSFKSCVFAAMYIGHTPFLKIPIVLQKGKRVKEKKNFLSGDIDNVYCVKCLNQLLLSSEIHHSGSAF